MRTTLTLDDDLAALLKESAHRQRKPFKVVLNEAIRAGLTPLVGATVRKGRFKLKTFRSKLRAGIDESRLNQVLDQLEVEDFGRQSTRRDAR